MAAKAEKPNEEVKAETNEEVWQRDREANIFQRMTNVTADVSAVAKNLNVGYGKNTYKAVCEADVLAAVKPLEIKHGIYSYPLSRQIIENAVLTSTKSDGSESKQQFMRLKVEYRFVNIDDPDDYIDMITYGDGVDSQDKAPGKAMTYADKYALLKAYKIITGDDPDQNASESLKGKQQKKGNITRPKVQNVQEGPVDEAVIDQTMYKLLMDKLHEAEITEDVILRTYKVKNLKDLSVPCWKSAIKKLDKTIEIKNAGGNHNEQRTAGGPSDS